MVGEVCFTEATFADADDPIADMPLIVLAKVGPFCSRLSRSAFGVDPLKNFSQLDLIVAVDPLAPDPLPVPPAALLAGAAEAEAGGALEAGGLALELGLLEQAVTAAMTVIVVIAVTVAASIGRDITLRLPGRGNTAFLA